jgi:RNA polymerase sigma-70 factor, ECF subfamily
MSALDTIETATAAAELLARAKIGEREAFTELVERHHRDLVRVAYAITGDLDAACDSAQQAWIKAWQRLPTVREPGLLRSWLIAIAANEARQHIRARGRRRVREIATSRDESATGSSVMSAEHVDLGDALEKLPPADRGLIAMRYLAGLNAEEIGMATGLTASGVRSRLARLIARLREDLDHD